MSIFDSPTDSLTKEERVSLQIDAQLRQAAQGLKSTYDSIRRLIYNNTSFKDEYGVVDSDAVFAAFSAHTKTGLTVEQLGQSARATKAMINLFVPGKISDEVPPATITFE